MSEEGGMPAGAGAPRPAPRTAIPRPAPPPRQPRRNPPDPRHPSTPVPFRPAADSFRPATDSFRSVADPIRPAADPNRPAADRRPRADNRLALVPHPCFDPRYRDPSLDQHQMQHLRKPPAPRLIRPSEHLALVERQRQEASARALVPVHRRPPDRPPQHLVPVVAVLERPTRRAPPVQRMIAPVARISAPAQRFLPPPPPRHNQQLTSVGCVGAPGPVPAPSLPPALFGAAPRTLVIRRPDARHGFGFTLRHLVVYPPDSLNELYDDGRHLAVGVLGAPMDTIFVRSVRAGGPAAAAGLRAGDRVVAVNDEPVLCGGGGRQRAPYARVVQLAQREPRTLRLTVVPRDHDLLQRYFSEAAYNPETNQRPRPAIEMPAPTFIEHESRLFDAYRRPRATPQAPPRAADEAPEYASVASLGTARYEPRRESDSSIPSAADSKDSLGSFDSNSTLTGRELDDSIILSRIRKSLEQKEAFLRRPSQPTGWVTPEAPSLIKQKEFYARPQKMQKTSWPPAASSPPSEDCAASVDSGTFSSYGEINGDNKPRIKSEKGCFVTTLSKIHETPSTGDSLGSISNGSSSMAEDSSLANSTQDNSKYPVPEHQLVTTRARQFESGVQDGRTAFYQSELALLSTTHPEPTVALRRREFETRSAGRRDTRSLDAQPDREETEEGKALSQSLSGNQLMITGSKHLHCPPPEGYVPEVEKVQMRARSNSTGSEGFNVRRHHASDGSHSKRRFGLNREQMEAIDRSPPVEDALRRNGLDTLTAEAVRPRRPTQLSLAPAATTIPSSPSPATPADSGFADDSVTRRQKKDAQMGEEERAMRRVSYLKATWGDRLHVDSDAEQSEADHHLQLRSAHRKWRPPRFADDITPLRRIFEEFAYEPPRAEKKGEDISPRLSAEEGERGVDIEGMVQVKMVVSNGKRASDRSWKQVWAVLQGAKLHLYRHHPSQSPAAVSGGAGAGGGGGGGGEAHGSRDTLDVRYSMAVLADDYTKRKHVLRLTTAGGAELLIQADSAADSGRWLRTLKRHSAAAVATDPDAGSRTPVADAQGLSPLPPQRSKKIGRNRSPTGPPTPTLPSSPKTKTWKGRMARQLRRMHGGGAASAQPPASAGWLGAPLERCPSDPARPGVPLAVSLCAAAVEAAGLRTVGVYRVPGNAAGVAALAAALDRGDPPPPEDPRWGDVHVASSLLKNYLRKLPDSLLTADLYPAFIAAERAPPNERARELRRLVRALPDAHYETLKFLMEHLRRVVAHADSNKMEARNLAIVFGPTLVRGADDDMLAMVNDMSSQCRIIESLVNHYEWYFDEEDSGSPVEPPGEEELAPSTGNRDLLIHNVKKIEGKVVTPGDIMSSIISAANRKMQRKPRSKPTQPTVDTGKKWSDVREKSPTSPSPTSPPHHLTTSLAHYDGLEGSVTQMQRVPYSTIDQNTQERIKKFEQETIAMLQRPWSSRAVTGGVQAATRAAAADLVSKELAALAGKRARAGDITAYHIDGTGDLVSSLTSTFDQKLRTLNNASPLDDGSIPYADEDDGKSSEADSRVSGSGESRTSTSGGEERVSPSVRAHELKTAWLSRDHRLSSSSSADDVDTAIPSPSPDKSRPPDVRQSLPDDTPTEKKEGDTASHNTSEVSTDDDKSVELVLCSQPLKLSATETPASTTASPASVAPTPAPRVALRLSNPECVKRNSAFLESDAEPDPSNKENGGEGVKLKRSESLNRSPERNTARVLRSESLNCRDSPNKAERPSKAEKADGPTSRRRDAGAWRSTKLKRKNGMPERGIKRRHTVGGTKDFDKDAWSSRHTRTSSPDLTHVCLALVPPPRPPLESHV